MKLSNLVVLARPFFEKNAPTILTSLGISAGIVACVDTACQTAKVVKALDQKREELGVDKLTKKQVFETSWKYYIRPATVLVGSIGLEAAGLHVANKRLGAAVAAYTVTESLYDKYQEETEKVVGKEKAADIRRTVNEELDKRNLPTSSSNNTIIIPPGKILFKDDLTNQFFEADYNQLKTINVNLISRITTDIYTQISVNEWLTEIGLETVSWGDKNGWDCNDRLDFYVEPEMTKDHRPYLHIYYQISPKLLY